MSYQNIMFDLDGTVTDSGKAITESVQYALAHFGMPNEPMEKLRRFVGPSLMDSFQGIYGMDEADATEAVRLYRSVYETEKMYDVIIYPGVEELLLENKNQNRKNILVTSKPQVFAEKILAHWNLSQYFEKIVGPSLTDPSSEKVRLIRKAMEEMSLDPRECIMIGDTKFDIVGAKEAGIDSIGVTYGFGTAEDLKACGATYLVDSTREILNILK